MTISAQSQNIVIETRSESFSAVKILMLLHYLNMSLKALIEYVQVCP